MSATRSTYPLNRLKWVTDPFRPITYGIVQAGDDVPDGVPYIRPVDMHDERGIRSTELRRTAHDIAAAYRRSEVRDGDVVVSIGPSYGKVMIVPTELKGANLTQGTARVAPMGGQMDSRFLFWVLRSQSVTSQWAAQINATTFGGLNLEPLANTEIPHPDFQTQQAIASFLDCETARIDALIEKKTRFIELLREKRQALTTRTVTLGLDANAPTKDSGVSWLGSVPANWKVVALKHLVAVPITDGPHETPTACDDGIPFVSAEALSTGQIDFAKIWGFISAEDDSRFGRKYRPQRGDIYMVKSGATTGVTAIVDTDMAFNIWSPLAAIRCNEEILPHYLLSYMRSRNFQEAIALNWSFGTQQNIGMGVIGNLRVAVPPLPEQEQALELLSSTGNRVEALIQSVSRSISLLRERRAALITAAVTGQIDVRAKVPDEEAEPA